MRRIVGILVAAILIVISGFLAYIATRPTEVTITRGIQIAAPPAIVFAHVNDFHKWTAWSPWEDIDPQLKRTYSGADSGRGAEYAWAGNDNVGTGKMTITGSRINESVAISLEFQKPMAANNDVLFTFTPEGPGTNIAWTMKVKNGFAAKAFFIFMDEDKMIGGMFEKGLQKLKAVAEARQ